MRLLQRHRLTFGHYRHPGDYAAVLEEMAHARIAGPGQQERTQRRVRCTLDLDRSQHRFLRQFALDVEVDASAVMRALLRLLAEDAVLAERVRAMVAQDSDDPAARVVPRLSRDKMQAIRHANRAKGVGLPLLFLQQRGR